MDENIEKLDKFALKNLYIGLYFSTVSMVFFIFSSYASEFNVYNKEYFFANSIQKIVFTLGFQTIGLLFFRSYRNNITDKKYFLNEKTNIEVIFSALESSIISGDSESEKKIYEKMSEIERNFLIKNGDTTINIKQSELDYENDYRTINLLNEAIKGISKKTKSQKI